ncbi:3-carboxy-cis,cis-muconate cycloisomerase [Cognatishimia sp. F0-27]|uniref:3-carboxy-cis,cis-muconate cycloisomerase n=1 Tax=Cognatishimia sp. F0-27 TaxID=2816855 RepID=UPI001D0C37F9|nr:3-carboxy-cis,cis-muconate cycloisomerase [Cognatishimia sp. F0-27]MCC1494423.1 3-carboxy-cis,cis-muconate cycloisomerase [Cognatishimia sp. F0-27]
MVNALTSSGLFGTHFHDPEIAALFSADAVVARMVAVEGAWTEVLARIGAVDLSDAEAALAAMAAFRPDHAVLRTGAERDGLPVPALVHALRQGLAKPVAAAIHHGLTSQDVIDTAMVLILRDALDAFDARLAEVLTLLDRHAAAAADRRMMGWTRMQAALPIPVAARIATWRRPLAAAQGALPALRAQIGVLQCAGPVGLQDAPQGQGPEAARLMAERLGLTPDTSWHADRAPMLAFGHWLVLLCGALGKLGQDIALMAQQGVDAVTLSGGGGSSAMPHKQNPVRAEALVTVARFVAAQQGGLAQALLHEQERSGAAWALEWMILPAMTEATGAALEDARALLDQITRIGEPA